MTGNGWHFENRNSPSTGKGPKLKVESANEGHFLGSLEHIVYKNGIGLGIKFIWVEAKTV